jgi:hypothetical protein
MAKGKNTTVVATRLPDSTCDVIKSMAEARNMTISEFLKAVIEKGLAAIEIEDQDIAGPQSPAPEPAPPPEPQNPELQVELEESPPIEPSDVSRDRIDKSNKLVKMAGDKGWNVNDFFVNWLKPKFGKGTVGKLIDEELDEALRLFEQEPVRKR